MSKSNLEIAADIVQELLKARGEAIAVVGVKSDIALDKLLKEYLSDEAVAKTYKEIFKAVDNPLD